MKKFAILGYFKNKKTIELDSDWEVVNVPFINDEMELQYGIERCLNTILSYGIIPTDTGLDILSLATLVYLADTRVSRMKDSQDSWTREFLITVPVNNVEIWSTAKEMIEKMLNFLTGDRWGINFFQRDINMNLIIKNRKINEEKQEFDVVSLFSGGMDSLISTINILQEGQRPLLISHAGDGLTKNVQTNILNRLSSAYNNIEPLQLSLWMVFDTKFIPQSESENTTRSRSFLFIAVSIFALSGIETVKKLKVPENGLIALNVPLDNLRTGSHSTRTTHPYYLKLWNTVLQMINVDIILENDYWNKTKGEMTVECKNLKLLQELIPISISCSSPGKVRWDKKPPQHCGYCVPCIIRRAAMQKAFGLHKDKTCYSELKVSKLTNFHNIAAGMQIRSFQVAIARIKKNPELAELLINKPGPLHASEAMIKELADVYRRGLIEVSDFIDKTIDSEKGETDEVAG